jgi:uncharacterized membrane protein
VIPFTMMSCVVAVDALMAGFLSLPRLFLSHST